ncbi:elongation factor Ts [Clostridium sp. CAG:524]|nr:translation elongation factor Ts [Clostridium sp.]CDA60538.1 elongation factor Ts [Clostridium sp. CAG:524]
MNISASMVKELREKTGAGMMDCKKALVETNGDMEKAIDYLREKGISKAAKKAERIAAEGLSNIYIKGNDAVVVELNSETDFVAKNAEFKELLDKIGNTILENNVTSMEEALNTKCGDETINDLIVNATAKIGEKISLRRFEKVTKTDSQVFGSYLHMGGKISSLTIIEGGNEEVARDVAMQAAAMRPQYINIESVPAEDLEREKAVIKEQVINEGKKPEFADKIVEGRIRKFYEETVLEEQAFIKDSGLTVKAYLENNKATLVKLVKYEVGEGMEKRNDDFAAEVMSQIK